LSDLARAVDNVPPRLNHGQAKQLLRAAAVVAGRAPKPPSKDTGEFARPPPMRVSAPPPLPTPAPTIESVPGQIQLLDVELSEVESELSEVESGVARMQVDLVAQKQDMGQELARLGRLEEMVRALQPALAEAEPPTLM